MQQPNPQLDINNNKNNSNNNNSVLSTQQQQAQLNIQMHQQNQKKFLSQQMELEHTNITDQINKKVDSDQSSTSSETEIITRSNLNSFVDRIIPSAKLDPEVEDILIDIADDFIESVTNAACNMSKHRKSDTLEVKDLQFILERNWNIKPLVVGYPDPKERPRKTIIVPESEVREYTSRIESIQKTKSLTKE